MRTLFFIAAVVSVTGLALGADTSVVGWVGATTWPPSAYAINGTPGVAPARELHAGDRVSVLQTGAGLAGRPPTITLYVGGRYAVVDAAHSPYCVGAAGGKCGGSMIAGLSAIPAVVRSVLSAIAAPFRVAQEHYYSAQTTAHASRGETPPALAILERVPQETPITDGTLSIPWLNGEGPFKARLLSSANAPIAQAETIANPDRLTTQAQFAHLHLRPGTYKVEVTDSSGIPVVQQFQVVAQTAVPAMPMSVRETLQDDRIPADVRATWRATLLRNQGAQWMLAAYQVLSKLPADAEQVPQLRYLLAEGP